MIDLMQTKVRALEVDASSAFERAQSQLAGTTEDLRELSDDEVLELLPRLSKAEELIASLRIDAAGLAQQRDIAAERAADCRLGHTKDHEDAEHSREPHL